MSKYEAIGVVEVRYFTTALKLVDNMCKTSEVELLASENKLGGRLVSLIIGGSISNVEAAIEAAKLGCEEEHLKAAIIISRPHEEIMKFIVRDNDAIETIETKDLKVKKKTKKGKN
ncbi:hypothetical protein GCM10008905_19270 [Clostridium malenominatum]|uniref:BMC domain-containing protein n=1 Tax=Clostridium malenominatum TaxID=1539 RepID=A0ABN1J0D7_9CLOT